LDGSNILDELLSDHPMLDDVKEWWKLEPFTERTWKEVRKFMDIVYVLNDSGHDFTDAERYGKLIFVTKGLVPSRHDVTAMYRIFTEAFKESKEGDYILVSGPTMLTTIACSLFAVKHRRLNLLLFTRREYQLRSLVFNTEEEKDDDNL